MLVIHGLWPRGGPLTLWGEDSEPSQGQRRRGRPPKPPRHPFAAQGDAVDRALGELVAVPADLVAADVVLTLPTEDFAPCASPELVRADATTDPRGTTVAQWRVRASRCENPTAFEVLRALAVEIDAGGGLSAPTRAPDPLSGGTETTIGGTLRYLARLAEFAGDLVQRGRVLPEVITTPAGPEAVWRPVLTGEDAEWAKALVLAMPPAVAAADEIAGPEATAPSERERIAVAVVSSALDDLVDAAARRALAAWSDPLAAPDVTPRRGRNRRRRELPATVSAWLGALAGERRFDGDQELLERLTAELAAWRRGVAPAGAVRACFRLVEPPPPGADADERVTGGHGADSWRVEFALQAVEEPSLVVSADRVWRSRGASRALAKYISSPHETFLSELGRASRLWPELESALRTASPSELELDGRGAHVFLSERAPLLAAAGFGVLLPSWWGRRTARLGARLTATAATARSAAPGTVDKASGLGLEALVEYHWEIAVGDATLTEAELRGLAALKTPLVRLRGQWVELDPARLAAGLKILKASGTMTVGELLRAGLAEEGPAGLPVVDVHADGRLGELLSGAARRRLTLAKPSKVFTGTLRGYQRRGLSWLAFLQSLGLGGVLADDMGLGKTVQVLALLAGDPPSVGPTLLVCPMSLVGNWEREAARFAPKLRVHVHHGAERARGEDFSAAAAGHDLIITTYSLAARDAAALSEIEWHRVVVDEAQAIKNAATRQATAVRALPARHRIALTGTPVENRLADLWSIMEFANPGLLGTAAAFKRRYAEPVERHGDEEVAARLKRITGPFVLRRLKTDKKIISDLPEKLEMEIFCNLTTEQASLYQAVVDDMVSKIEQSEGIERRGLVLATMTKLKQACNHPAQLLRDGSRFAGRSGKLARLEEILEEVLASGEKALLFTQYAEFGRMLKAHLSARFSQETLFLHGAVPKDERDAMVTRFQSERPGSPAMFVLSLKAGGTGLNLTAANHVVHVDRWWNPAVEDQATDRAFRIGQHRRVQVRKFVCAGTVEEKIATMIGEKRQLAGAVVGDGERWLTELSTDRLREVFALQAGAVVE